MKNKKFNFQKSPRSLKILKALIVLILILSPLGLPVNAQECASIQNVSISEMQTDSNGNTFFKCNVEVNGASAGSEHIACGIRNNEKLFPEDYCPSGIESGGNYFGGWNGKTATFQCVVPQGDAISNPNLNPQVVGYDFRNDICGPDKGKAISLTGINYVVTPESPAEASSQQEAIPNAIHSLIEYFYQMRQEFIPGGVGGGEDTSHNINSDSISYPVNNALSQNVVDTVNSIVKTCGNVLTTNKIDRCLNFVQPPLSQTIKNVIAKNASDGGGYFQCVGAARLGSIIMNFPQMLPYGAPTACKYAEVSVPGYTFIPKNKGTIQVGDMPIWGPTPCGNNAGHIAFVINVQSPTKFDIMEANYTSDGYLGVRTTTTDYGKLKGWLRPIQ